MRLLSIRVVFVLVSLVVALLLVFSCDGDTVQAAYVGSSTCAGCHQAEHKSWQGSHHDQAMQHATPKTVLGDFNDAEYSADGMTYKFFRQENEFRVRTQGTGGRVQDFKIPFVFGVEPLQQYLVEFPGGRLQTLRASWDSRPKAEGGQRWFHQYPAESIGAGDPLYWTARSQNWNLMCAACHSTSLRKNYDGATDSYKTTWAEIDVGCEACHGPGAEHVAWAKAGGQDPGKNQSKGLRILLRNKASWELEPGARTATRKPARTSEAELETCAPCHSRRSQIREVDHGGRFLDGHRPALLEQHLYHADGQIRDEVYVWGSFVQSKMRHQGVTCSDCHDPHSLRLKGTGNRVCLKCHDGSYYDAPRHHHHKVGTPGASCVECHMPETTYMVIDPRRDHSIRIPRPDLTMSLQVPNACNRCHDNETARWASEAIQKWRPDYEPRQHFAPVLKDAWNPSVDANTALERLANDPEQPGIARASALALLENGPGLASSRTLEAAVSDKDGLVRMGALRALLSVPLAQRVQLALPLLKDPLRAVRLEAGRVLASAASNILGPQRSIVDQALAEYIAAQALNADQDWAWLNLGLLYTDLRRYDDAEAAYKKALALNPASIPACANLADFYRLRKRDPEAEKVLMAGIAKNPRSAALRHALGLLLVRQKRMELARRNLEAAVRLQPQNPRYSYVLGLALNSMGQAHQAIRALEAAHRRHPGDRNLLFGLTTILRDVGKLDQAIQYAHKLVMLTPGNPNSKQLLEELQKARKKKN